MGQASSEPDSRPWATILTLPGLAQPRAARRGIVQRACILGFGVLSSTPSAETAKTALRLSRCVTIVLTHAVVGGGA